MALIRTKIVATVGPATSGRERLRALVEAGADVFRINFSHGDEAQRGALLEDIRSVEEDLGKPLAVMADLCGPKIRVGLVEGGLVVLEPGAELVIGREPVLGTAARISTTLPELVDEVRTGEPILLADGALSLVVVEPRPPDEVLCRVVRGGPLGSGKGVNLPATELGLSSLTEKDSHDVEWIASRDVDYVALSFVRRPGDVEDLRRLLAVHGCDARVVAKIEKPQALEAIEAIVQVSDAVMVARGDLGVEMDLASVPLAQKRIARLCQAAGKPCIIATQMLESMISAPSPTRAEVSDVANAVFDQTDAVMLSAETAVGAYPVEAVDFMNRVAAQAETFHETGDGARPVEAELWRTEAALAWAARELVLARGMVAVAVFTGSGTTARMLAKSRLPCPILAMSPNRCALRRAALYYGVLPVLAEAPEHTGDVLALASRLAVDRGIAEPGDQVVVLSGRPIGAPGATSTLVIHSVG